MAHFFRTYMLWAFASLAVLTAWKSPIATRWLSRGELERVAFVALAIVTVFSVAQVLLFAEWRTDVLYNPFREWMYLGPYDATRFASPYVVRAPGFYLEPSFNAFVTISLYVICVLGRFRLRASSALTLLSLYATQSMTGFLAFVTLWLLIGLKLTRTRQLPKGSDLIKLCVINLMLGGLLMFSGDIGRMLRGGTAGIAAPAAGFSPVSGWILGSGTAGFAARTGKDRLAELEKPSTSGYYRLVAPLPVLKDVLESDPFGKALGQMKMTVSTYHLLNGTQYGTTIDNGVYYSIFYFGWVAVALLAFLAYKMVQAFFAADGLAEFILLSYIFISFQFSGGILAPEYLMMLVMILYQFKSHQENRGISPTQGACCSTAQI